MFELDNPLGLIEALAFIAWSDRKIAPEEISILENLISLAGLDKQELPRARAALCERPDLAGIAAKLTDPVEARFAVVQAILLAHADGEYSSIEREDVARLSGALGFTANDLEGIYAEVERVYLRPPG